MNSKKDFYIIIEGIVWTQDESQIDSIFRSSGLYRQKWDNHGGYYGKRTIVNKQKHTSEMLVCFCLWSC